jgi:hypothetical protein
MQAYVLHAQMQDRLNHSVAEVRMCTFHNQIATMCSDQNVPSFLDMLYLGPCRLDPVGKADTFCQTSYSLRDFEVTYLSHHLLVSLVRVLCGTEMARCLTHHMAL